MRTRSDPNLLWEEVSTQAKDQIWAELKSNFSNVRRIHRSAVEAQACVTFRKWKNNLKNLIIIHRNSDDPGLCPKPGNVESQEHWEQYMRHIDEPDFLKRSAQNAQNRSKSKCVSKQGRTPLVGYHWDADTNPSDYPLGRDPIAMWKVTHTDAEGRFVNDYARHTYEKLLTVKERIAPNRRATHEEDVQICEEVFGSRRDSVIGLGPTQSKSSPHPSFSEESEGSTSSRAPTHESMALKSLREHCIALANAYTAVSAILKLQDPTLEMPKIPELPIIPGFEVDEADDMN